MEGTRYTRGPFIFTVARRAQPAFTALSLNGYSYAFGDKALFQIETIKGSVITGNKVKRDGTTGAEPVTIDAAATVVYAVSRKTNEEH